MAYNLGIDIGIASIGFAGANRDTQSILSSGVHIFEAAENPKTGASLAEPRRTKRGMRVVIHRRAVRKHDIRRLLAKYGLKDIEQIDCSRHLDKTGKGNHPTSPWDLRKAALERRLTDAEFARILFHIAKRRGFQSNKKGGEANDLEGKKALSGAQDLQVAMTNACAPTIGAYLSTLSKQRNGDGSYERFVTRDLLREEIKEIFKMQRKFGNDKATAQLEYEYAGSGKPEERNTREGDGFAFYQRPLQSSEHLVGSCFFTGEKRAPKFSYTAELFILWTKLNNCKIKDMKGNERVLTQDEKNRLAEKTHALKSFSYKQARKELDLSENERFNIGYRQIDKSDNTWEKIRDSAEGKDFLKLAGYHALKAALDTGSTADWQRWIGPDRDKLDDIARILSFHEDKKEVDKMFSAHELNEEQKKKLCGISNFSKTVDLSLTALRNILPHMQKGVLYDEACRECGYDHSRRENKGLGKIPPFEDVRNPVVNRALAQARKVINAVIRKHGMPDNIIVELARDVGKPFKDRKDIEREQKKNESYREEAKKHVAEILGMIPDSVRGGDILKYRLCQEQQHFCLYCGSKITPDQFKDGTSTQIDHIIPYSRSWDDSYMNKVLCHTGCNQEKENRTPFEWLGSTKRWDGVISESSKLPPKKAERLLTESFDEKKANEWKERALNDTRYMARLLKNHLEEHLNLGQGNRVQTRNGQLTAHLRGAWGFPDKDRRNDRHHAIDAIVLACSTQSMVQKLSEWNKYEARRKNPAERPFPPVPWENFRADAMAAVYGPKNADGKREGGIFVSRMPVRKITGAAHQDTIYSHRQVINQETGERENSTIAVSRKPLRDLIDPKKKGEELYKLLLQKIEKIHHKDTRSKGVYKAIKQRVEDYQREDKDPKTVFNVPIYMSASRRSLAKGKVHGEEIRHIRLNEGYTTGLSLYKGEIARTTDKAEKLGAIAPNTQGGMVRVDVFCKPNKRGVSEYYLCPVYIYHFAQQKLPSTLCGLESGVDESFKFLFSLCKNDLVRIKVSENESVEGYYTKTDVSGSGRIWLRAHDSDLSFGKDSPEKRFSVKTALSFEKYSVDYFGNIRKVEREVRRGVADLDDSEPSKTVSV